MIEGYFVLKLAPTPESTIVTSVDPIERQDKMDIALDYLENCCDLQVIDSDEENEVIYLCKDERVGYLQNEAAKFDGVAHLTHKIIVIETSERHEKVIAGEYELTNTTSIIEKYDGASGARGYDVAEELEEKHDFPINLDWEEMENTLDILVNI